MKSGKLQKFNAASITISDNDGSAQWVAYSYGTLMNEAVYRTRSKSDTVFKCPAKEGNNFSALSFFLQKSEVIIFYYSWVEWYF